MKARWMTMSRGLGALAMAALVASGCAKKEADPAASTGTQPVSLTNAPGSAPTSAPTARPAPSIGERPSLAAKVKPAGGKGAIVGYVNYVGTPPKPRPINFGAEKVCADLNNGKSPLYETLVVNPNSTVKGTLVTIRGKVPGDYTPPAEPVVIDQVGCIFTPHVAAAMVGQEVEFRNSDSVSHNIRGTPTRNQTFNNVFAAKAASKTKFDQPEMGVPIKCDIHFWMSGYVHVLPHPFFAITGDDGSFVIPDVPPGNYTLVAWHETLKSQTVPIVVKAGEVAEVDFTWPNGK